MSATTGTSPGAAALADVATALEARATEFVREHRLPGASVAVVHGDDLAWSAGVGFCDIGAWRAPDEGTLYRVASITKTFTGTAIMQLRDEGRLGLDDPVAGHLPELRAGAGVGSIDNVTIRMLLSHESGLMGDPPGTDWHGPTYQGAPAANLARAAEIGTRVPPYTQQKYSNMGYQLLGEVVARVSGRPYAEYVQEQILDPLEMGATGFLPLPDALEVRRAIGYAPRGFSDELRESVAAPDCQAEGGLLSCVEDMARWISFQLREDGGERSGAQVLAGPTLAEMHRPRYLGDLAWTEAWGISWYAVRRDDVIWVQHSGGLHGFRTNVCFETKHRVGAIALVNGDGDAEELAMDLGTIARAAVAAAPRPVEPPQALPEEYRDLLGLYSDPDYGDVIRLEWRDGKLTFVAQGSESRPTLSPTGVPDAFVVDSHVRDAGEPCVFQRRADGRVRAVAMGPSVYRRLDPVD
jgi:CubicO group peptidase (beta-lactamase class C family)